MVPVQAVFEVARVIPYGIDAESKLSIISFTASKNLLCDGKSIGASKVKVMKSGAKKLS